MTNHFTSGGGEQNIAQGDHAIGKQVNNYGISPEVFAGYVSKLAVTESALASFFKILEEQQVPLSDLDSKLREIAAQHKKLLSRMETVQSADPQVVRLKGEARQAIEAGEYAKAEDLLNQAEARDMQAIEELEQAAKQRRISAAVSCAENAKLQEMQFRYKKAAEYWQKAADLLPEESKREQAIYLHDAGYSLYLIADHKKALTLLEQSLAIIHEIGDRNWEVALLNGIAVVYSENGDYSKSLSLFKKSLAVNRDIGNFVGEAVTNWNIGINYEKQENFDKAEQYINHALQLKERMRWCGDLKRERRKLKKIRAKLHGKW